MMIYICYVFVKVNWYIDIVDQVLDGFCQIILCDQVDVFDVFGVFEMLLMVCDLVWIGCYVLVVCVVLVVDGGIYCYDFVVVVVVQGLMQVGLEIGVLVLLVLLMLYYYQEIDYYMVIFCDYFVQKGCEVVYVVLVIVKVCEVIG